MASTVDLPSQQQRVLALDALRGLSVLLMVFASSIPFGVALPSWLYHAQEPPPTNVFNPHLPGITWVDLVFPFFLFTMGAAIPIALSKRLRGRASPWRVLPTVLWRFVLLVGFAVYVAQIRPQVISNNPNSAVWLAALVGFALLFPALARFPKDWSKTRKYSVRIGGWIGAVILMALLRFPDGSGFSLYRSDIIILVLANVALFGGVIWLFTREHLFARLGIMGFLIALRLSAGTSGWIQALWNLSPVPWAYQLRFLQYLLIAIPGTIVGDLLVKSMDSFSGQSATEKSWDSKRMFSISAVMVIINVAVVAGLEAQWVFGTTVISVFLCMVGWQLLKTPVSPNERLLNTLYKWGVYWFLLGMFFEPYEGGIKKDPSTLSYYFVTSGLAIFALMAMIIFVDVFQKKKGFAFLIDSGQNPMVAYAGINSLILPLLALTRLNVLLHDITPTPWLGVLGGAFVTYLVALATTIFTRKKIFLRT